MEGGAAVWRCEGGGPPAAGVRACEGGTPTPGVGGVWVGLRLGSRNLQVPVLVQHNEDPFNRTDVVWEGTPTPGVWKPTPHMSGGGGLGVCGWGYAWVQETYQINRVCVCVCVCVCVAHVCTGQ